MHRSNLIQEGLLIGQLVKESKEMLGKVYVYTYIPKNKTFRLSY